MVKRIDQDTGQQFSLHPSPEWLADVEQFNREACRHDIKELRRASVSNGALHIRHQCIHCGELIGSAVPKAEASNVVRDADLDLRAKYQADREQQRSAIDQKHIRLQRADGNLFKKRHREYLASAAWKVKRDKVLRRANGVCEGCLETKAQEVHHLTYEHWGQELLFELVALCPTCHAKCHPDVETEDEPAEQPCYACRYVDWDQKQTMLCGKFGVLAQDALLPGGECGPDASELEPLR